MFMWFGGMLFFGGNLVCMFVNGDVMFFVILLVIDVVCDYVFV